MSALVAVMWPSGRVVPRFILALEYAPLARSARPSPPSLRLSSIEFDGTAAVPIDVFNALSRNRHRHAGTKSANTGASDAESKA